jgi:hypothetical protein
VKNFEDEVAMLRGLTAEQMNAIVLRRVKGQEAERYLSLTRGVSLDVRLLVSARTLLRAS